MKRDKIIYWAATGLVALGMFFSAYMYLTGNAELLEGFKTLGYPLFVVSLLGVAKLLGAVALVAPVPSQIKEWAYAGFTFTFIGAVWTHIATGTPWVMPLVFLVFLGLSYYFRLRLR
jgi:hypothetical protein